MKHFKDRIWLILVFILCLSIMSFVIKGKTSGFSFMNYLSGINVPFEDTAFFQYPRIFFENSLMEGGYFYSHVKYKSPGWVENENLKIPVDSEIFFTPGNSLKLKYVSRQGGYWDATIDYNNWRGKDHFEEGNLLAFKLFIRTETNRESLPFISIESKDFVFSETISLRKYLPAYRTGKWLTVSIPLKDFQNTSVRHSDDIIGISFSQGKADGNTNEIYIDQLEITPDNETTANLKNAPHLTRASGYERHVDVYWDTLYSSQYRYIEIYRSEDGKNFQGVGISDPSRGLFTDYTGIPNQKFYYRAKWLDDKYDSSEFSNTVDTLTHLMSDSALLSMVQEASFRYYWNGAEPNSGMTLEDIPGRKHMIATGASGFGMMAVIVGVKRGFISRQQAVKRFTRIVHFLQNADKFHGAFSHFIDGRTGKVIPFFGKYDDGGDLVETSFLMEGLLTARQFFDRNNYAEKFIRDGITQLWKDVEWNWYTRFPDSNYLYWHWSPDYAWHINHRFVGFNEAMITYLLAIASPTYAIKPDLYYKGWASQTPYAQQYRINWGGTKSGSMYTNGQTFYGIKLKVGVSSGGPLFFTHYSYMGFDPHAISDAYTNYFENNRSIALINYRYCLENPNRFDYYGKGVWGITASDGPFGYNAHEPVAARDDGTIAPTGAISSFPYTPEQSMEALKVFYRRYGKFLWGEYGFRDAFNLKYNWCAQIYMGLNQAPQAVMIENYRSGFIWDLFMKNPEMKKALDDIRQDVH